MSGGCVWFLTGCLQVAGASVDGFNTRRGCEVPVWVGQLNQMNQMMLLVCQSELLVGGWAIFMNCQHAFPPQPRGQAGYCSKHAAPVVMFRFGT